MQADDRFLPIQRLDEKGTGKLEGLERHGTAFESEVHGFATQKILRSDVPAIPSWWKQDTGVLDRAHREPRMEAKTKMRWPIRLQVREREPNLEAVRRQTVIQRKIHLPGIL